MNEIQNSILDAWNLVADAAVRKSQNTLTIEAKILDIDDSGLNSYKVEYMGSKFKAYATNQTVTYAVGDKVYVLVPNGDFTKEKIILSATQPTGVMYSSADNTGDSYLEKSNNLFADETNVELCSYKTELNRTIDFPSENFDKKVLESYFEKYSTLSFSCRIRTNLPREQRVKGNYGLVLRLPYIINKGGTVTQSFRNYVLDIDNMLGNPYNFKNWTTQKFYIDIDKSTYDYSVSPQLYAFVKDFSQSTEEKPNDIFIYGISLTVCDKLSDAEKTGYYLSIVAEEGELFLEDQYEDSKKLTPILKINGKDTSVNGYDCYWFVEDSSIDETSEYYLARGGRGWKCLNARVDEVVNSDGSTTFQYDTRTYEYKVLKEDVSTSMRYKCVLVYGETLLSDIVTIKNLDTSAEIQLITSTGFYNYVKNVGVVRLINRVYYEDVTDTVSPIGALFYDWARYNKEGNYVDNNFFEIVHQNKQVEVNSKLYLETEIKFPAALIEDANTFICTTRLSKTVEGKYVEKVLGAANVTITVGEGYEYIATIQNGDIVYKYDTDGDSPAAANYDGSESSVVKSIKPLEYRVFRADGSELTENEYEFCRVIWSIPKNSMIQIDKDLTVDLGNEYDPNYWYVAGFGKVHVPYTIAPQFNASKMDNNVLLSVEFDSSTITASENIKFLKEGASGTNGTKYTAVIEHNGYALGEKDGNGNIRKFQAFYIEGKGWKLYDIESQSLIDFDAIEDKRALTISVYRDGEKIQTFDTSSVEWSMFDETSTTPCFSVTNGVVNKVLDWTDPEQIYCNIVQARINVSKGQSEVSADEFIYAYYPIEISYLSANTTWASGDETKAAIIPTLQGGFYSVMYAADGTNPQYDSTYDFECRNEVEVSEETDAQFLGYNWEASSSLSKHFKTNGNTCSTRPNDKYDNAQSKNYIKATLEMSNLSQQEAITQVKSMNEKKAVLEADLTRINSYITAINTLAGTYNKYRWSNQVDTVYELLMLKLEYIKSLNYAERKVNEFYTFCENNKNAISPYIHYTQFCTPILNFIKEYRTKTFKYGDDNTTLRNIIDTYKVTELLDTDLSDLRLNLNDSLYSYFMSAYTAILKEFDTSTGVFKALKTKMNDNWNAVYYSQELIYFELRNSLRNFALGKEITLLSNYSTFASIPSLLTAIEKTFSDEKETYLTNSLIKAFIIDKYARLLDDFLVSGPEEDLTTGGTVNAVAAQALAEEQARITKEIESLTQNISHITNIQKMYSNNVIHIRPIVVTLNRYGLASINGWDGNKIYTGSNNQGDYLYAPQIGAGRKEEDNSFTGMIMGLRKRETSSEIDVGLFGYNSGEQTIFLNSKDGSATFGVAGTGQIIIKPGTEANSSAVIYGGNYVEGESGLLIDLTAPSIKFGSGNFEVTPEGYLTAKAGGSIAGWQIGETVLKSMNDEMSLDAERQAIYTDKHTEITSLNTGFYLGPDGFSVGKLMRVSDSTMQLGDLTGKKWIITTKNNQAYIAYNTEGIAEPGYLKDETVYIGTNGISLGKYFKVTNKGIMYVGFLDGEHWRMSADRNGGTNAYIFYGGNDTIPGLNVEDDSVYIGTDGMSLGMYFRVTRDGMMKVGHLNGKHWRMSAVRGGDEAYIFYGDADLSPQLLAGRNTVYIGTDGISLGKRFKVDSDGNILAGNLESTENKYWIITASGYEDNNESYIAYGTNTFNSSTREGKDSVYIGTDGISLGENKFWVDSYGSLYSIDAYIGGWTIDNRRIHSINPSDINEDKRYAYDNKLNQIVVFPGIKIDADGAIQGGYFNENLKLIDDFRDKDGKYFTKNDEVIYKVYKDSSLSETEKVGFWEITEKGYATFTTGNIAGWEIEADRLEGTNMTIYAKGAMKGGSDYTWSIDEKGVATFSNLIASTGGTIGGWTIEANRLLSASKQMEIKSDGSIGMINKTWYIDNTGVATFTNVNAKGVLKWPSNFKVDANGIIHAPAGFLGDETNSCWFINGDSLISCDGVNADGTAQADQDVKITANGELHLKTKRVTDKTGKLIFNGTDFQLIHAGGIYLNAVDNETMGELEDRWIRIHGEKTIIKSKLNLELHSTEHGIVLNPGKYTEDPAAGIQLGTATDSTLRSILDNLKSTTKSEMEKWVTDQNYATQTDVSDAIAGIEICNNCSNCSHCTECCNDDCTECGDSGTA